MNSINKSVEQPRWCKQNWKWTVPVGGCVAVIIVTILIVVGGVFAFVNKATIASGSDQALKDAQ